MTNIGKTLAITAVGGLMIGLVACGGGQGEAADATKAGDGTEQKASCNGGGKCKGDKEAAPADGAGGEAAPPPAEGAAPAPQ